MREALQITLGVAAAALLGTVYVLVHERRRKAKAIRKQDEGKELKAASTVLTKEKLIAVLKESANAAYQLIEQTRKMVHVKAEQAGISLEKAVDELQQGFESAMDTVCSAIRAKHGVTEQMMSQAIQTNQADAEVQQAVTSLREAIGGKMPAHYGEVPEEPKRPVRKNKSRRKG